MANKRRHPQKGSNPDSSKRPRAAPEAPQSFRWRTDYADLSKQQWGWGCVSLFMFFRDIAPKLQHLEASTWGQLFGQNVIHDYPPHSIAREAQNRLASLSHGGAIPDDWAGETLYAIGMTGLRQVWGFKVGQNFHLLWWDPNHTVYLVPKRHT